MTVTLKPIDRYIWQQQASLFKDYNYRQLWDFGIACAERLSASSEHVAVYDGAKIIGMADVRIKLIPFIKAGIAAINGGPLVRREDGDDCDRLKVCLNALVREYVHKQGLLLRVNLPVGPESWNAKQNSIFTACGFSLSQIIKPYRTLLLDLDQPLDEIRKNLSQKWRNNLKRAEAVNHPILTDFSVESFNLFPELYNAFRRKKQFDIKMDPVFFAEVQNLLPESERMRVALCQEDGVLISGHISSLLGDTAVNLFRANTKVALSKRVSYRIQWDGVCYAHEQGYRWYDLGGIDPEGNPGVYSFKKGMGGEDVTGSGPFEYYPGNLRRMLIAGCEKAYKFMQVLWE